MNAPRPAIPALSGGSIPMGPLAFGVLFSCLVQSAAQSNPIRFVNASAQAGGDGLSWTTAFNDLQLALDAVQQPGAAVAEIWVAVGTYKPSRRSNAADARSVTFQMVNGVSMYGGFAGGETDRDQRDAEMNATILSGDLSGNDAPNFVNNGENAYHVLKAFQCSSHTLMDGFLISGGNANTTASFNQDRDGGGMHVLGGGPNIAHCRFIANNSLGGGSGVYLSESNARLLDCSFFGNKAGGGGGAALEGGAPEMRGCIFPATKSPAAAAERRSAAPRPS